MKLQQTLFASFPPWRQFYGTDGREITNTLIPKSQPSLFIFHWSGVQLLKGTEQEKEKWAQLLQKIRLAKKTGTETSSHGYFSVFNNLFIYQLLFTHNTQKLMNNTQKSPMLHCFIKTANSCIWRLGNAGRGLPGYYQFSSLLWRLLICMNYNAILIKWFFFFSRGPLFHSQYRVDDA